MNIKEGIEKRFSVRAFTKEVPDMKLISEILKTANAAPSGGNIQPVSYTHLRAHETR